MVSSDNSSQDSLERKDSPEYRAKKQFFDALLTVYGRKPVLEALRDPAVKLFRLHLAESNKPAGILDEIIAIARTQGAEIRYHDRKALSRISKNSKQDQGVAADLECAGYQSFQQFLEQPPAGAYRILALDRITNPQNLGMIIRSACAGQIDGILLPEKGGAQIDSLVIKASAGTLFKAPILRCPQLNQALEAFRAAGADVCALSSHAPQTLGDFRPGKPCVYVLGNETEGVSKETAQQCNRQLRIPMNNGVESLNVAVTAALIAFQPQL
ncbi:TrmH family RNA methyltransferase [Marinimicrobium sp. C2-29]|uniref:TrmH family RNA methyltransferase n=1 Tax=Marinimicrobium sp. C2-29 TaxID=3139825 RepID=UPI00313902F7